MSFFEFVVITALSVIIPFCIMGIILYRKEKQKYIINILLSLISVSFVYIMLDVAAGYYLIDQSPSLITNDELRHHKAIPGSASIKGKMDEFNIDLNINSFGLRGTEVNKNDVFRILMLGDSFTMGVGVNDNETFSAVLNDKLKKVTVEDQSYHKKFEVLNGGMISYSPLLSYIQLKELYKSLQFDLVVFNFDMSDLLQEQAYRNAAKYDSINNVYIFEKRNRTTKVKIKKWIYENLYLTGWLLYVFESQKTNPEKPDVKNMVRHASQELLKHTFAIDDEDRTKQWNDIFESILNIRNLCMENNSEFSLAVYPWAHQVNDRECRPGRNKFIPENTVISDKSLEILEEFADKNNIRFLNTFPAFRNYNGSSLLYYNYDVHWRATGHELMADELKKFIIKNYLHPDTLQLESANLAKSELPGN